MHRICIKSKATATLHPQSQDAVQSVVVCDVTSLRIRHLCLDHGQHGHSGDEGSVVLDKVENLKGNNGYNAATGDYGDMLKMGILDPAKVTRSALQAAASVAGLMLTTEAMISELPEDNPPAMPGGGGMPDMGGMGGMM